MKKKEKKTVIIEVYEDDRHKIKKWALDRKVTTPEMVNLIIKKI